MVTVQVRLFAGLREMIGARQIAVSLADGATVGELQDRITEDHPVLRPFMPTVVCAVGEEYVSSSHVLREGDLVALIPPVSGGA
jgi:molybdopterin converting factor subunit 1